MVGRVSTAANFSREQSESGSDSDNLPDVFGHRSTAWTSKRGIERQQVRARIMKHVKGNRFETRGRKNALPKELKDKIVTVLRSIFFTALF